MPAQRTKTAGDFMMPLLMNGLQGRMLLLPPPRSASREILVVYGQHASLEHWWPLAVELNQYGAVTMPDLPGFGGMQSFYKIGDKPSLNSLADYLAAFVKLRYKRKRLTIVGIAFGFAVVTRMLQRYPDLAKKVDLAISIGGVARYDDLALSGPRRFTYRYGGRLVGSFLPAQFVRYICLHPSVLRRIYSSRRLPGHFAEEENWLWRHNDTRTHFRTLSALMKFDNCLQRVDLPLWHVAMRANQQINSQLAEQHLRVVFRDVTTAHSRLKSQALGTVMYNPSKVQLLPAKLRRALSQT